MLCLDFVFYFNLGGGDWSFEPIIALCSVLFPLVPEIVDRLFTSSRGHELWAYDHSLHYHSGVSRFAWRGAFDGCFFLTCSDLCPLAPGEILICYRYDVSAWMRGLFNGSISYRHIFWHHFFCSLSFSSFRNGPSSSSYIWSFFFFFQYYEEKAPSHFLLYD